MAMPPNLSQKRIRGNKMKLLKVGTVMLLAAFTLSGGLRAQENKDKPAPVEPSPAPATQKPEPAEPAQAAAGQKPEGAGAATPATDSEKGLRMNFRGVPLDMVLNYLSDAAGFIIVLETKVEGKVDVWSNQPLSKDEAVDLLNTILNKNDYSAIRNGRVLTIVKREDAKTRNIPVKKAAEAEEIPKGDAMVTQV